MGTLSLTPDIAARAVSVPNPKNPTVYVVYGIKQYKIEGVFTSLRKASAYREKLQRDGLMCEIVSKNLNEEDNDTQE